MDDAALERLELKLAYLEQANETLGEVVYRQQRELAALAREVDGLRQRLTALASGAEGDVAPFDPVAERPPHY